MSKIELLAPAGNFDCLMAAVQSGADAVYLSEKKFGARSYAANFDYDELREAVKYCHLRNVDVHVTVNTLVSDKELFDLEEHIKILSDIGIDAVIVQDIGVLNVIRKVSPNLPVHASTQMTIHNLEGVLELERLGVSRVVLSRELSLKEIEYIVKNCSVEIEVFGHGAICMSYSGQCLMSSMIGGRSGNRGKCAQPCRLPYFVNNSKENKCFLSPKDMISLPHLAELERIGVSSLKIEGRMKGVSYVSAVVSTYRKYLDEFHAPKKEDLNTLNEVFFRGGLTDGYFTGKKGAKMFSPDKPDNPYEKNSKETIEKFNKDYSQIQNKVSDIDISLRIVTGDYPKITAFCNGITVNYAGSAKVQKAEKSAVKYENVFKQISKLGGTPFKIRKFDSDISDDAFISVKELNDLRRNVIDKLSEEILSNYIGERPIYDFDFINREKVDESKEIKYTCSVLTIEQFEIIKEYDFYRVYVPLNLLCENTDYFENYKERIIISLPVIIKNFNDYKQRLDMLYERGYKTVKADNIAELFLSNKFKIVGGFRLNVFNSISMDFFSQRLSEIISVSPEMNIPQIRDLRKHNMAEAGVYGRTPLMVTENCIMKNADQCPCSGNGYIIDRKGMKFPIVKDCGECRNIVLNSLPVFMGDKTEEIKKSGLSFLRLDFTIENSEEVKNICDIYLKNKVFDNTFNYTRAYFNKGALA